MKTELSQQHPPPLPAHKVCPGQSMAPAEPRTPSSPQLQPHSTLTAPRLAPQSCGRQQPWGTAGPFPPLPPRSREQHCCFL